MSLLPNSYLLIGTAVALVMAFIAGVRFESNSRDALLLVQERAQVEAYKRDIAKYRDAAQAVSKELIDERASREGEAVRFRAQMQASRVSGKPLAACPKQQPLAAPTSPVATLAHAVGAPGPIALRSDEPRFTAEFARLFDLALGSSGLPGAGDPGRADAASPIAGTVDAETVLVVHGENADAWRECRAALRGWQALARQNAWVK